MIHLWPNCACKPDNLHHKALANCLGLLNSTVGALRILLPSYLFCYPSKDLQPCLLRPYDKAWALACSYPRDCLQVRDLVSQHDTYEIKFGIRQEDKSSEVRALNQEKAKIHAVSANLVILKVAAEPAQWQLQLNEPAASQVKACQIHPLPIGT